MIGDSMAIADCDPKLIGAEIAHVEEFGEGIPLYHGAAYDAYIRLQAAGWIWTGQRWFKLHTVEGPVVGFDRATSEPDYSVKQMLAVLIPCPFCGGSQMAIEHVIEAGSFFVICLGCLGQGGMGPTIGSAVAWWNSRKGKKA